MYFSRLITALIVIKITYLTLDRISFYIFSCCMHSHCQRLWQHLKLILQRHIKFSYYNILSELFIYTSSRHMNIYRWNTSKITRIPSMGTIRRSVVSFKCRPLYH